MPLDLEDVTKEQADTSTRMGQLVDKMYDIKLKTEILNQQIKALNNDKKEAEEELLKMMQHHEVEFVGGTFARAKKGIKLHASVSSKVDFYRWVVDNNAYEFAQARVSAAPVKEMLDDSNLLPAGVETYTEEKITSLRKL